jgi:hypothetical protein
MMVLVQFERSVMGEDGRSYKAKVCGRQAAGNMWEGWIEFEPSTGPALRTPRETTQPNQPDLEYWASGLTEAYLEGALERALAGEVPSPRPRTTSTKPAFDGPLPEDDADRPGDGTAA